MKNLPIYIGLYKFYDPQTIIEIFKYCQEKKSNRINYSLINRIKRFITIEDNRRRKRLDFPIYKFILDAQNFAVNNPYVTKLELDTWIAEYAAKLGNVIKNVVIDDTDFLETIYDLTVELFDIVVIKKRPKNGVINIEPFKLLWEKKIDIHDIYGGYLNTKEFFLQDLVENMKTDDKFENEKVNEKELPHTPKLKLDDVKDQIDFIVNKPFNYYEYSELDGSNDRFLRKQRNTNQLSDPIFDKLFSDTKSDETIEENNIFNKDIFGNKLNG